MEVWIRDLETGETRSVFGEGMYAFPFDWSPDGTKLLAVDVRNNSDSSIHVIDLESGDAPELTPHDDDGLYIPGLGPPTARASTSSPTRAASFVALRSTTSPQAATSGSRRPTQTSRR